MTASESRNVQAELLDSLRPIGFEQMLTFSGGGAGCHGSFETVDRLALLMAA